MSAPGKFSSSESGENGEVPTVSATCKVAADAAVDYADVV